MSLTKIMFLLELRKNPLGALMVVTNLLQEAGKELNEQIKECI